MSRRGFRCHARTLARRYCRRVGAWLVHGDSRTYCWQHAVNLVRDRGLDREVKHFVSGRVAAVAVKPVADDARALPQGETAVVAAFNRARTVPAFNRCRKAVLAQIGELKDERTGLKAPVLDALHAARRRVGLSSNHTGGAW